MCSSYPHQMVLSYGVEKIEKTWSWRQSKQRGTKYFFLSKKYVFNVELPQFCLTLMTWSRPSLVMKMRMSSGSMLGTKMMSSLLRVSANLSWSQDSSIWLNQEHLKFSIFQRRQVINCLLFWISNIFKDLVSDDVMILDAGDEVYVWIGEEADEEEKINGLAMAKKYLDTDPTPR